MSVIFGIVHFQAIEVDDYLNAMENGCSAFQVNSSKHWSNKNVGLGNLLRYNTPESVNEDMPYTLGGNTITAYSRIDNRQSLMDQLNIPFDPDVVDSILILKAYEKWKEDCVHHLEGDWVFAIWDNEDQKLLLSSDHMGNHGLYYYKSNDFFVFCSSLKGLLALSEIPKIPNDLYIAGIIAVSKPSGGQTAHKEIYNLLPATNLTLNNQEVIQKRYWELEKTSLTHYKSTEEYIKRFLEIYKNAVHNRMRCYGEVGTMLSGGLDSGSVSALVAQEMKQQSKKLKAYTSIPLYDITGLCGPNRFGNETEFAQMTADYSGNIDIKFINGEQTNALEALIKSIDIQESPIYGVSNALWINELLLEARKDGVSTLFTGQAGNGSISWVGMPQIKSIKSIFRKYKKDEITLPELLKEFAKLIQLLQKKQYNDWESFSIISTSLKMRTGIEELKKNVSKNKLGNENKYLHNRLLILKPEHAIGIYWQEVGYSFGIHIVDPTKDKELVEFCLSIPDNLYRDSEYNRLIIRKAMEGILPESIRWNKRRGYQSADAVYKFRAISSQIKTIIDDFEKSEILQNYLDIEKMKKIFYEITEGEVENRKNGLTNSLLRGISIGLHLKKYI